MCIVTETLCRGGARESNQNCDYNIVVTCARLVTALAACDIYPILVQLYMRGEHLPAGPPALLVMVPSLPALLMMVGPFV